MRTFLTGRLASRPRRIALLIALLGVIVLGVVQVQPASAWTVERAPDRITFHSERMEASNVRATVHLALFASGNYEFRIDLHNGARIKRNYRVGGEVRVPGMLLVFTYDSGMKEIAGRRNDEWETLQEHGHDHRLFERWSAVDAGPLEAHFWLRGSWNQHHSSGNDWARCGESVCDAA